VPPDPVALMPIRSFTGMSRLADALDGSARERLSRVLASLVLDAVDGAGIRTAVITADPSVARWATRRGARVLPDPGSGLSHAAAERMLYEVEFLSPRTLDTGESVFLKGYVFERDGCSLKWKSTLKRLQLGGERGYGWGSVELAG